MRCQWAWGVAVLLCVVGSGCSSGADLSVPDPVDPLRGEVRSGDGADGGDGGGEEDRPVGVSQLDAVVLDLAAPVDGASGRRQIEVAVWSTDRVYDRCGVEGQRPMSLDDRYNTVLFPELDRFRTEGMGGANDTWEEDGEPLTPEQEECLRAGMAETAPLLELTMRWEDQVVRPLTRSSEGVTRMEEALRCIEEQLGLTPGELPDIGEFFGSRNAIPAGPAREEADREHGRAFADCAEDYYGWLRQELLAARAEFQADHAETLSAMSAVLADAGYVP